MCVYTHTHTKLYYYIVIYISLSNKTYTLNKICNKQNEGTCLRNYDSRDRYI